MEVLYLDDEIIVCIKPAGMLSTDEPGGLPSALRDFLGEEQADVRTVHRLDRVVSGVMVLARSASAASELSRQMRERCFDKEYLAVVHGQTEAQGTMTDLLRRDPKERKTYVTDNPGKGVQPAVLDYRTVARADGLSCVRIHLQTGRTHQIRAQFSSRNFPLVGDRKYSFLDDGCPIALWSWRLEFFHPRTGEKRIFSQRPPDREPWQRFSLDACLKSF